MFVDKVRTEQTAKGKVVLRGGENPCEGHVEIYYNNITGYVGDKHWNSSTEEVVCRTTQCGVPVPGATKNVPRLESRTVWLNELQCSGDENDLWDCGGYPAPGVSFYQKPTVKMIKCSDQIEISLEPQQCHGVAKYSVTGNTSSSGYFCKDNWGSQDVKTAELLCKNLGCGGFKEIPRPQWVIGNDYEGSEKMAVDCSGIDSVTSLWQCIRRTQQCKHPVVVTCEGHERLQLQGSPINVCSGELQERKTEWKPVKKNITNADNLCEKLNCGGVTNYTADQNLHLTCTDTVKVVLMNNRESKCFGQVYVNVNGSNKAVCGNGWTDKNSQMICKELNCGKSIQLSIKDAATSGVMDYVECLGDESSLWHCKALRGQQLTCQNTPHIICSGIVQAFYEGDWLPLSKDVAIDKSKDFSGGKKLNCPADYRDVKYCVSKDTCQSDQQAFIWCKGYTPKEPDPTPTPPPPTSTILIGLGVSLVVLILIIVFIRNRILRRNRKSRVFPQMFPDREEDLDSEMYEDIHKSDEMEEDFRQERFFAETESVKDGRAQSSSSLQYDDVDESDQPLADSIVSLKLSVTSFPFTDGVSYEVEDVPENYDDVEDISANVQTTADVHNQLQATPKSSTAPPEGQQRDEDYLEPNQDGTTQCGVPVPGATKNVPRLESRTVWLNELQCSGDENDLWDCGGYPAPGVSFYQKPTVKMIKCSDIQTAELLCRNLGCGGFKEIPRPQWVIGNDYEGSEKMAVDCSGIDSVTSL
ncbi:Scavenger receptor cysteine-rich type 1 protein M160 [Oryzias melastigma]|uniref:Scavenger receptor cysteine-rich type 1 protein M160 n=1 Tax=Oryzias melastigma TaxID=30732 RepID=A0A834BKL6_ORYME|nr:Scavenger receptor cysteine-rich type 1 protein M160 [Oryzias melastigma]